jgi:uncharacterized protein YecE (DUF72 family)
MENNNHKLFIGTSGFNYTDWKGKFYPKELPEKYWLSYYGSQFNTVEVNATFYRHFRKKVFEHWASQVQDGFKFGIKGPRFITHQKKLVNVEENLDTFFESVYGLGNKLGLVLWQFPASFVNNENNYEKLQKFLKLLPSEVKHVFEFRHKSWFVHDLFNLLNKVNAGFVSNDSGKFQEISYATGGIVYVRLHGPTKLYSSKYSDEQLQTWAKVMKLDLKKHDVYAYFNNDLSGFAIENAKKLQDLVA